MSERLCEINDHRRKSGKGGVKNGTFYWIGKSIILSFLFRVIDCFIYILNTVLSKCGFYNNHY